MAQANRQSSFFCFIKELVVLAVVRPKEHLSKDCIKSTYINEDNILKCLLKKVCSIDCNNKIK